VELLVVLAIIGILVALLLPAIQAARDAARRAQCSNNLRQMGVAMHNYHDIHNCFPPGSIWVGPYRSWASAHHRTNWAISLLPHLEEGSLHNRYHDGEDNTAPANAFVREMRIDVYSCPSDLDGVRGTSVPAFGIARDVNPQARFHFGSYRGVAGRTEAPYFFASDRGHWSTYLGFRNMPNILERRFSHHYARRSQLLRILSERARRVVQYARDRRKV